MLKIKSVYDPIEKSDGLRILATRIRGRGLSSDRYHVWMANLGPSEKLMGQIRNDEISWAKFCRLYKDELLTSESIDKKNKTIKNKG